MNTTKPTASASAPTVQQRIKAAVTAARLKAEAAQSKLRSKLDTLAASQVELASLLADKSMPPADLRKKVTAVSGSMARILAPYRNKSK